MASFMKNPTRHKINEANHFLSRMKQTFDETEIFYFNLSAFLSAARSVTFNMQHQYKSKDGFPEWYRCKQIKISADPDLIYLTKARNKIIHVSPIASLIISKIELTIPVHGTIVDGDGKTIKEIFYGQDPPTTKTKLEKRLLKDHEEKDIISFCEEQLNKLTQIVEECEQLFA